MKPLRLIALAAVGVLVVAACGEDGPESSSREEADTTAVETTGGASTTSESSAPTTLTPSAPPTTAPSAPPTTAPDLAAALSGRTFVSQSVEGFTLVDGTQIVLTFDETNVGAAAGCNQLSGTWSLEGDVLVVPPMAQTQMACDPAALMDQDTWLASVLTSRPTLTLDGDTLTITAQGATVTLVAAS